jgi:hypothetical protein
LHVLGERQARARANERGWRGEEEVRRSWRQGLEKVWKGKREKEEKEEEVEGEEGGEEEEVEEGLEGGVWRRIRLVEGGREEGR